MFTVSTIIALIERAVDFRHVLENSERNNTSVSF